MAITHNFFVTCAKGAEGALRKELLQLGLKGVKGGRGGAHFSGNLDAGMRACLWSRIGARVLLELGKSKAQDAESLYEGALEITWDDYLGPDNTFAIRATLKNSNLNHSGFVALKVKDAVADRLREKKGRRPNVNTRQPDLAISVHIDKNEATLFLDMSDEPLHRRGWRSGKAQAPLKENLAASILRIGDFDPTLPLCDPMCGTGTLAIEAAHIARNIAPGIRRGFGFERWPTFNADLRSQWQSLRQEAKEGALERAPNTIFASDHSSDVVETVFKNSKRARVFYDLKIREADARNIGTLPKNTVIFSNPPYGERLGRKRLQLEGLYRKMGEEWMGNPSISRVVLLSANPGMHEYFKVAPSMEHELYNGSIRCSLLEFRLR